MSLLQQRCTLITNKIDHIRTIEKMPLRDHFKKKDNQEADSTSAEALPPLSPPQFKFVRSDTYTQEIISLPDHPTNEFDDLPSYAESSGQGHRSRLSVFTGRSRSQSTASNSSNASRSSEASKSKERSSSSKRLSQRLGLRKQEPSSSAVPQDLPDIQDGQDGDGDAWEQRATILARENEKNRSRPGTPVNGDVLDMGALKLTESHGSGIVASERTDDNIQEAIRLHEAGQLEDATRMFGRLADPGGENNALSQVLYALALR